MDEVNITRQEKTSAFTYEVTLVVQVLAETKEGADNQLEAQGGYVSSRKVKFIKSTAVYDAPTEESLQVTLDKLIGDPE